MEIFLLVVIVALVGIVAFLVLRMKPATSSAATEASDILNEENQQLKREKAVLEERLRQSQDEASRYETALETERDRATDLTAESAKKEAELKALQDRLDQQKQELETLQQQFKTEFENIASKILKQNTAEFSVQHQKSLDHILNPFKERIERFEKQVKENYDVELRERATLKKELEVLSTLNQQMSKEATNLTKALKGDNKVLGNWGEIQLERVLEESGLKKGIEYDLQVSSRNEDGSMVRPDVVINLPDGKHVIIDAKANISAYEAYVTAEPDEDRERFASDHVRAIRTHITDLGGKKYHTAKDLESPDFVLMFICIESSYSLAIHTDPSLVQFAWDNGIALVSPTTLLATLRMIALSWRHENQHNNVMRIADEAGKLYDKFVGYLEDLDKLKRSLKTAQTAFDSAEKRLHTGSGNIVRKTQLLKDLGAKTRKNIDRQLVAAAKLEDTEVDPAVASGDDSDNTQADQWTSDAKRADPTNTSSLFSDSGQASGS